MFGALKAVDAFNFHCIVLLGIQLNPAVPVNAPVLISASLKGRLKKVLFSLKSALIKIGLYLTPVCKVNFLFGLNF